MQRKIISLFLLVSFVLNTLLPYTAQAAMLPSPTQLVGLSQGYSLPTLRGLKINPKNPLNMEFIIDPGTDGKVDQEKASLLIKYFLAALTIPQENLWVNLSTYEQNRVIPPSLSQTDLGADMLAQDYILKQVAASITYPETETGKQYWQAMNGSVIASNAKQSQSFNKIWITAKKAKVYEGNNTVIIVDSKLTTMMDEDYLATSASLRGSAATKQSQPGIATPSARNDQNAIFKQTILPKIEKDINEGKNFANLRQIYNAIVLAIWFKNKFKESFYKAYLNKDNVKGIDTADKQAKDKIYGLYVEAFTKGVYNYVKRERVRANDYSPLQKIVRRQYYSGGGDFTRTQVEGTTDKAVVAPMADEKVVAVKGDATPNTPGVTGKLAMLALAATAAGSLYLAAPNKAEAHTADTARAVSTQKINVSGTHTLDDTAKDPRKFTSADIFRMFDGYENWNDANYDDALNFLKAWYDNFLKDWPTNPNQDVSHRYAAENAMLALCNSSNKRIREEAFKLLDENWWLDEPEALTLAQKYLHESDDIYIVAKAARFLVHYNLKAFNDFANNAPERWRRTIAKRSHNFGDLDKTYLDIYNLLKPPAGDTTPRNQRLEAILQYNKGGWYESMTEGVLATALYDFQDSPEQFTLAAQALGELGTLETMEYLYRFITGTKPALSAEMAQTARATFDSIAGRHNKNPQAQWALLAAGHSINKNKYELAAGGVLLALGIYRLLNKSEKEYARRLLSDESISEYVQDLSPIAREYSYKKLYAIYKGAKKNGVPPALVFQALTKMRRLLVGKNDLSRLGRYLIDVGRSEDGSNILKAVAEEEAFGEENDLYKFVSERNINANLRAHGRGTPGNTILSQYHETLALDDSKQERIAAAIALGKLGDGRAITILFGALRHQTNGKGPMAAAISQALINLKVPERVVEHYLSALQAQDAYHELRQVSRSKPLDIASIRSKVEQLISFIPKYSPTIFLLSNYAEEMGDDTQDLNEIITWIRSVVDINTGRQDQAESSWRMSLSAAWKERWGVDLAPEALDAFWYAHATIDYSKVKSKLSHVASFTTPDQRAWLIAHQWLGDKPTALGRLARRVGARLVSQADNRAFKAATKNLNGANLAKKLEAIAYLSQLNDPRGIIVLFSALKTAAGNFSFNPFTGKVTQPDAQKQLQDALQESLKHLGVSKEESDTKIAEFKMQAYIQFLKTNEDLLKNTQTLAWFMRVVTELANANSPAREAFIAYAENLTTGFTTAEKNLRSAVHKAVKAIFAEQQRRLEHMRPLIEAWEKAGWNRLYKEQLEGIWYVHSKMSRGWHVLTPAEKASMQEPGAEAAAKGIKGIISYKGKEHNVYLIHTGELAITECSNDEVKAIFAYLEKNNLFSKGQASWLMDNGWLGEDTTQKLTTPDSENRLLSFIFEIDQVAGHDPQMRPRGYVRHMEAALRWRKAIMESGNVKFEEVYAVNLVDKWYDRWAKYPAKNKIEAILKERMREASVAEKAQSLRESGIVKEDGIAWLIENKFLGEDENGPGGNPGPKKNPDTLALVPGPVQDGGLTWKSTGIEKYGNGNFYFENIPDLKSINSMGFVINAITPNKTIGQFLN